jgi:prepilin-type N-terminal cleavage/methylation domain-containing protein
MEALLSHPKKRIQRGFTLIEVLLAIAVLTFGLLALAGFIAQMSVGTNQTRYMQLAAMLASEKLEDLNRIPNVDPSMTTAGGDLTTNVPAATFGTGANKEVFAYNDQVQISTTNGLAREVIVGTDTTGTVGFWEISTSPNGTANSVFTVGVPVATADDLIFTRRWAVEVDKPAVGLRRITVLVSLVSPIDVGGKVSNFQATLVRP